MPERLRLFVAFEVPEDLRRSLESDVADLKEAFPEARWTALGSQHITLKFLGSIEAPEVAAAQEMCGEVASKHPVAEVSLAALGAFPNPGKARVLWAGIADPSGISAALAADLDHAATALGIKPEDRAYRPHLTLCRFERPARLGELPQVLPQAQRTFEVEQIVLFRSHLSSQGANYEAIERFALG